MIGRNHGPVTAVALVVLLVAVLLVSIGPAGLAARAPALTSPRSGATPELAALPVVAHGLPPASASPAVLDPAAPATTTPASSTWTSSNFFQDIQVSFSGTGLSSAFLTAPYTNTLPSSTLGFWLNISSAAPILFANVTIWGTQWPGGLTGLPINGFTPSDPAVRPMQVNVSDPSLASFYFDDYRFFWPGSNVGFNVSVVGQDTHPSEVKSAWNESVPMGPYAGGYVNDATWIFNVGGPWSSPTFTNDIAISTTPNVLSTPAFEPNSQQKLSVSLEAIDLGGTLAPIPTALLEGVLTVNETSSVFSESFGPANHTQMTLAFPLGPYPGAKISFNVSAWLPWEGGQVDRIVSPTYTFNWTANGGWWHPLGGLSANLQLAISPTITESVGTSGTSGTTLPTASPVNITLHEPIENVTIASAQVQFTYSDQGLIHTGVIPMTALTPNTTAATLPGLPPGAAVTFVLSAKDIFGDPIESGNYSYTESGPTNPSLPAGRGLIFAEVLDLSGGGLLARFPYTLANSTWAESGTANPLGFAVPLLPAPGSRTSSPSAPTRSRSVPSG